MVELRVGGGRAQSPWGAQTKQSIADCVSGVGRGGTLGFLILIHILRLTTQFGVPVINVLWTIVAGRRFPLEEPKVMRMMNLLNR